MANYTKNQILNFISNRITAMGRVETSPNDCASKWFFWKMMHLLVQNDIVTPAMVNAEFTEFP